MRKKKSFEDKVMREAKKAGLFAFFSNNRWEFSDPTTGKWIASWEDGKWWGIDNRRGKAGSPFGAMHVALALRRKYGLQNVPGPGA